MAKRFAAVCLVLAMALFGVTAHALPETDIPLDLGDNIVLLMEPSTGSVIYAQNADKKVPVASITKIMTLLVIYDRIDSGQLGANDMVTVSKNAAATEGSEAFLDAGAAYAVDDLVKTIIISSANDSSVAMAEHIAGSEGYFVAFMNNKAHELGMNDTHFATCTGLPAADQYSTAADVSIMARELLCKPAFFKYSSTWMDTLTHPGGRVTDLVNTNRLVRFYDGVDGVKTGYSQEAGHCLVATAVRNDMRLMAIVLGFEQSKARFEAAGSLLNYGFNNYALEKIVSKGEVVKKAVPVKGGSQRAVDLVAVSDLTALMKRGTEGDYEVAYNLPDVLNAPVLAHDKVGELVLTLPDGQKVICPVTIMGDKDITTGVLGQMIRVLRLWR